MRNAFKLAFTALLSITLMATGTTSSLASSEARQITVSAEGRVRVTPDAVRIYATVSFVTSTSKAALEQANLVSGRVRVALLENDIERRDIRTQSLTVYPEYNYSQDRGSTLVGYRASQSFDITVINAAAAGVVVDALVAAGGDDLQINSVNPFILNSAEVTEIARQDAVKNARVKARSYASLLKVRLDKVLSLIEGAAPSFSGPVFALEKNDAGSTQIDLGQQEVTVTVTVKWSIR
jgi:uncharacterized protein YggE